MREILPGVRRLHLGGRVRVPGWEVFDAVPGPQVDHVGDARDLSRFREASFAEIYASHLLEHFDYQEALPAALREWLRVLSPGGLLSLSVPDLDTLCRLFLDRERFSVQQRFHIMRMMFGGQTDQHDYHFVGLNEEFLTLFLRQAGFEEVKRVPSLGLFKDTSDLSVAGTPISLNMTASKPRG